MSIPPPRTVPQTWTETYTDAYGNPSPPIVHDIGAVRVASSAANFTKTPFVYHGKTQLLNGELFVEGEMTLSDAVGKGPGFKAWRSADRSRKHATFEQYQLAIRNQGWRPPTPYAATVVKGDVSSFQASYGTYNNRYPAATHNCVGEIPYGNFGAGNVSAPMFHGDFEDRAVIKALLKLKDNKVNLSNAFAEREQTVGLAINTLKRLTTAARSLRRGNIRGVAEALKPKGLKKLSKRHLNRIANAARKGDFHQSWLELQYGWKPLYADVYGAVSALHKADQDNPHRYSQTVKGSVKEYIQETGDIYNSPDTGVRLEQETIGAVGCLVRLDYFLENPFTGSLASLGITNPAETLWEITPFSFVVDWFLPVGDYLQAMDAATGFTFRAGSRTHWSMSNVVRTLYPLGAREYESTGFAFGIGRASSLAMERSIYSHSPLPRVPSFKNPFPQYGGNAAHLQNAIALFAVSLGGGKIPRRGSG